jgi:hypothetical protein
MYRSSTQKLTHDDRELLAKRATTLAADLVADIAEDLADDYV